MSDEYTYCGHGRTYKQDCRLCDAVWLKAVTLPEIKRNCQRALSFYEENRGAAETAEATTGLVQALHDLVVALETVATSDGGGA